jgi:signal transduction histidine kinase
LRTVLIADDDRQLAEAIAATLDTEGLETVVAHDGKGALSLARALRPDVILLDVMMPGKTGIEVCATLKSDPDTALIPVIFVTAKGERADRMAGIAAGADYYLVKPFDPIELITLVNKVLGGQPIEPQLQPPDLSTVPADQLVVYARELKELFAREQSQRQALEEAYHRLGELDRLKRAFISTVTHELLTPFSVIDLALQVLQRHSTDAAPGQREALDDLTAEVARLRSLVKGLVKFAELANKRREPQRGSISLAQVVVHAVQPVAAMAHTREVDFQVVVPSDLPRVYADSELLAEAVFQIAHNAVRFNVPGGQAQLRAFESEGWVAIEVVDTGVGLTPERLALLGQPFEQVADTLRRGREGLGIGWAFACYVAEAHGGRTHVRSPGPGQGSTFSLAFPVAEREQEGGT